MTTMATLAGVMFPLTSPDAPENDLDNGATQGQDAEKQTLKLSTSMFPFMSVGAFCAPALNVKHC